MAQFIGRQDELNRLSTLLEQKIPRLVVLKGRRRIGKSRLLVEFGKQVKTTYLFSGLAPEKGITSEDQRIAFVQQLQRQLHIPAIQPDDWSDLFWHLSQHTQKGQILIILDEITWMAMGDSTFLPKLKNAWDLYFSQNDEIIVALCGSISSWIEKNILSSTGFLGRTSLDMTLKELPLNDCVKFWGSNGKRVSRREQLIMLAITGGVPRYLEDMNPKHPAEENIQRMCFRPDGILFKEFEKIFSDLFSNRSQIYQDIVELLANGKLDAMQITQAMEKKRSGDIYEYLDDLAQAGFIMRDYSWYMKNGKPSKLSQYRLADNYSRFYIKYILPNQVKIQSGDMANVSLATLPGWYSMIGLQFENLVLNNKDLIKSALGIKPDEIVCDNPYFQRKTTKQAGCQIDYMIQTRFDTLYICEIKFSKHPIQGNVIEEIQQKINRLSIPRHCSYRPVLVHCGGVSEALEDSQFFYKIIDFTDLFGSS